MSATHDSHTIRDWWEKRPNSNIGGVVDPGMIVLDVDPRNGGDFSLDVLQEKHGPLPHTVEVRTGGGGRHLYFSGNVKGHRDIAEGVELLGQGCNVVLPGSIGIHKQTREIRPYEFEFSSSPDNTEIAPAPDWLLHGQTSPEDEGSEASQLNGTGARLTTWPTVAPRSQHKLPGHIPEGQRNDTLFRHGCLHRFQGKEEDEIRDALSQVNQERCPTPLPKQEISEIVEKVCKYPQGKGQDTEQYAEARATIDLLGQHYRSSIWKGKGGASRKRVLLAMYSIAHRSGRLVFSASVRQVATEAGLAGGHDPRGRGLRRVNNHIRALCSPAENFPSFFRRLRIGKGIKDENDASLYQIIVPVDMPHKSLHQDGRGPIVGSVAASQSHDVFRWGKGLGKNAEGIWCALGEKPYPSARQVGKALGMSPDTAERNLKKLKDYGLAVKDDRGGWHRGDADLDEVAKRLGTAGKAQEQRHMHRQEREEYQRSLIQRRNPVGVHSERTTGLLVMVPKRTEEGLHYAASFKKHSEHQTVRARRGERQKDRAGYVQTTEGRTSQTWREKRLTQEGGGDYGQEGRGEGNAYRETEHGSGESSHRHRSSASSLRQ